MDILSKKGFDFFGRRICSSKAPFPVHPRHVQEVSLAKPAAGIHAGPGQNGAPAKCFLQQAGDKDRLATRFA